VNDEVPRRIRTNLRLGDGGPVGGAVSSLSAAPISAELGRHAPASAGSPGPAADLNALIAEAAKDLADYQRLTAEGKLGEAGQKLEELKRALEKLNTRQR
jgi:uncharacterized protein